MRAPLAHAQSAVLTSTAAQPPTAVLPTRCDCAFVAVAEGRSPMPTPLHIGLAGVNPRSGRGGIGIRPSGLRFAKPLVPSRRCSCPLRDKVFPPSGANRCAARELLESDGTPRVLFDLIRRSDIAQPIPN